MSRVAAPGDEVFNGSEEDVWEPPTAKRAAPPIGGLFFDPNLRIDEAYAQQLVSNVLPYFSGGKSNQVMLFGSSLPPVAPSPDREEATGLPYFIGELIGQLADLLRNHISARTYHLLFPEYQYIPLGSDTETSGFQRYPARQVIFNLYRPGEGITSHVDLPGRFGDGIIGISLLSGTVMSARSSKARSLASPEVYPDT